VNSPDPDPDIEDRDLARSAIMQWRKAERRRLISERLSMPAGDRRRHAVAIGQHLRQVLGDVQGRTVGVYWPFRGEPSLRSWMEQIHARGARCALPVVIERRAPLVFRTWRPGAPMASGIWNIPVPADGVDVLPDIVVSPVVGFDPAGFRLGYGGGFYDRTLAAMARKPLVIGVGFSMSAITTIHPLPHDIPMQFIVTEDGRSPEQQRRA
jgi:5,10-methenyltetrahydrofolate synthetase